MQRCFNQSFTLLLLSLTSCFHVDIKQKQTLPPTGTCHTAHLPKAGLEIPYSQCTALNCILAQMCCS